MPDWLFALAVTVLGIAGGIGGIAVYEAVLHWGGGDA